MLYPRNKEEKLSDALFQSPSSEYRGTPFWAWNCQLEKEELMEQLEIFQKMGFGGAHLHVRTGMTTPYLSDEHMDLVKACVEKCRSQGMLTWLYDEDRWPSGAAGGFVTKEPKFRARQLMITTRPYAPDESNKVIGIHTLPACRSGNGYLLACYDVELDENGCLAKAVRIDPEAPATGKKWYAYVESPICTPWFNDLTYADTMNPEAIQKFIQVTHERYLETVGKDFGSLIPAIFTDEPQFVRKKELGFAKEERDVILPWTDDIPQTYQATYGQDILENLPELLWELPGGQVSATRYRYHDHICQRFTESFADQIGAWCEAHGIMLTGHMMLEPTLQSQTGALGEAMRSYRSFQLPGIDMLYNRTEFTTAKQTQSAVHQYDREGMISEMYGVTGWDFDFRDHKFQGDWQAALGVTVRVPHLSLVSMRGTAKRDYPASISYQSPWWQDYSLIEDHFARVSTAMTRGKAEVKVAVIHPIESYWLHFGPMEQTAGIREQLDKNFQDLTDWLLHGSIDFDFICESLFPEQCPKAGAPLQVGAMTYDTLIVPGCETLRSTTLERLEAFQAAGGKLIFLGNAPKYENALVSDRGRNLWAKARQVQFQKEDILMALEEDRLVDIRNSDGIRTNNLIHQLRKDGEDRWLFIAHSRANFNRDVPACQDLCITLKGAYGIMKYDTQTGDIIPMAATVENGKTKLRVKLYDLQTLLLRYTDVSAVPQPEAEKPAAKTVSMPAPQQVAYELEEPNVYLLDKAEFALNDAPLRPIHEVLKADNILRAELGWPSRTGDKVTQPWVIGNIPAEHTAHLRYRVFCTEAIPNVKLAVENPQQTKIWFNGVQVTAQPDGWFCDKSIETLSLGTLQAGENVIEMILPFGRRNGIEWCYLLGEFGVKICGEYREITPKPAFLGFDDVTRQGLAHYGSNITYKFPVTTHGGKLSVTIPHFSGAGIRVQVDGQESWILYPPYRAEVTLEAGTHEMKLQLLGNRQNCFGPVHDADPTHIYVNPPTWYTEGNNWTNSYRLRPLGIRSAPKLEEIL